MQAASAVVPALSNLGADAKAEMRFESKRMRGTETERPRRVSVRRIGPARDRIGLRAEGRRRVAEGRD